MYYERVHVQVPQKIYNMHDFIVYPAIVNMVHTYHLYQTAQSTIIAEKSYTLHVPVILSK